MCSNRSETERQRKLTTYMHVNLHAIAAGAADGRRHDDQGVLSHEVPYASSRLRVLVDALEVELEGIRESDKQQQAVDVLQQ